MIRGFYTSLAGLVAGARRESILADNLANVSTPGFKAGRSTQSDFGIELLRSLGGTAGRLGTATLPVGLTFDAAGGPIETTGRATDLAIEGDGLFVVRTSSGAAFTRAGTFRLDGSGMLVTEAGEPVLDTRGSPIRVPDAAAFSVAPDGTIAGTGQRLAVVAWPATGIERLGGNRYAIAAPVPLAGPTIRQGALERSNVDLAGEMTDLVATQRSFSLNARALSIQDGTLELTDQLGRLR